MVLQTLEAEFDLSEEQLYNDTHPMACFPARASLRFIHQNSIMIYSNLAAKTG